MELFGCAGLPILVFAFVIGTFHWTTGPILHAARTVNAPRSFLLSDLIWLLVQIQLAMAVASYAFPAVMPMGQRVIALVILSAAVVLFWLASLLAVSRAGINRPLRRAAVFVVILPGLAVAIIGMTLLTIGLINALAQSHGILSSQNPLVLSLELIGLAALALALRGLARWTVLP